MFPPGFLYVKGFAPSNLLKDLFLFAKSLPWQESPCQYCIDFLGERKCKHDKGKEKTWSLYLDKREKCIQQRGQELISLLPKFPYPYQDFKFSRVKVNRYAPFSGLISHQDGKLYLGRIAFITISGKADFCLQKEKNGVDEFCVLAEPGDLVVLSEESYFEWWHSVQNFEQERFILLLGDESGCGVEKTQKFLEESEKQLESIRQFLESKGITKESSCKRL